MRPILRAETLQIEWTSKCVLACSNCTHFSNSYYEHPELTFDQFKAIIDSLEGYLEANPTGIIGAIGGDPLLVEDRKGFGKWCEYARKKIPRERHGLWTTFPPGLEHYRKDIVDTFGVILLNDHTMDGIMHAPILVGIEEMVAEEDIWPIVDQCWLANHWSPVVNGKGAFFCEVAGSMAQLFQGSDGWKLDKNWWKKAPKDYGPQMEEFCRKCGCAVPLARRQSHTKGGRDVDDISPKNMERLRGKSRKVDKGLVQLTDFKIDPAIADPQRGGGGAYPAQVYKDEMYRKGIAARYGIALTLNSRGYWDPRLEEDVPGYDPNPPQSLFRILQQEYGGTGAK